MKKLLIACSMISACALVACADTTTPEVPAYWFEVTTSLTNGGALAVAVAPDSDTLCDVVNSKFEIDSDINSPVVFTASDSLTQEMARVTFNLDAAVVPNGALQQFTNSEDAPKVAFALYQSAQDGSTTNFTAWVGGGSWVNLSGCSQIPNEGDPYVLIMEFNHQIAGLNKVRFSIGQGATTNVLTGAGVGTDNWFTYGDKVSDDVKVKFVGCGKVASFFGLQFAVAGEIVVIEGKGKVVVNETDKTAFDNNVKDTGETVATFLAKTANTAFTSASFDENLTVGEAYALGLLVTDGDGKMAPRDSGVLKVMANAQASTTDGIPVNLNIVPPADSGATISYQLQGSTDGSSYTNIGEATTDKNAIKILTSNIGGTGENKYRYFKVVTTLTLQPVSNN